MNTIGKYPSWRMQRKRKQGLTLVNSNQLYTRLCRLCTYRTNRVYKSVINSHVITSLKRLQFDLHDGEQT